MVNHTTALLVLGLCLGQVMHTQEGALPRPSISAEPGSVIPRGRPVTIVCRGPAGEVNLRLEKNGGSLHWDERNSSPSEPEARFLFPSMSEDTAGLYRCLYQKSQWSERSEDLKLVLSREDTTQVPTWVPAQPPGSSSPGAAQPPSKDSYDAGDTGWGVPLGTGETGVGGGQIPALADSVHPCAQSTSVLGPAGSDGRMIPQGSATVPRRGSTQTQAVTSTALGPCSGAQRTNTLTARPSSDTPALPLTTEHLYILIGVSLAFLLCLLLLLLFCLHRQRQKKQGPPSGKGQLQRPQERLGLAVDSLERSPDRATADGRPEKDINTSSSTPAAGDPQEVTYAQLDHQALTERAARAVSPLTTESSTYVALARH